MKVLSPRRDVTPIRTINAAAPCSLERSNESVFQPHFLHTRGSFTLLLHTHSYRYFTHRLYRAMNGNLVHMKVSGRPSFSGVSEVRSSFSGGVLLSQRKGRHKYRIGRNPPKTIFFAHSFLSELVIMIVIDERTIEYIFSSNAVSFFAAQRSCTPIVVVPVTQLIRSKYRIRFKRLSVTVVFDKYFLRCTL